MSHLSRLTILTIAIGHISSTAYAVEVSLWLENAWSGSGHPGFVLQPLRPQGSGSEIDIDDAGVMTGAVLKLEGYSFEGINGGIAPWTGTLVPKPGGPPCGGSDICAFDRALPFDVQDPNSRYWGNDWCTLQGWRMHLTRMTSQSDFAGSWSLWRPATKMEL
jgi:hypothetical protein